MSENVGFDIIYDRIPDMSAYQLSLLFIVGYLTFLDGIICTLPVFVNYEPQFSCQRASERYNSTFLKDQECSVNIDKGIPLFDPYRTTAHVDFNYNDNYTVSDALTLR